MIYAYIRISTDRPTVENQRFEILKYCAGKKIQLDDWIKEVVSGTKSYEDRKLDQVLKIF